MLRSASIRTGVGSTSANTAVDVQLVHDGLSDVSFASCALGSVVGDHLGDAVRWVDVQVLYMGSF